MMLHLPCFNLERKAMANLDNVLKSRDITLLTKVRIVKAMVFPVVTYGYESWTIKKAEHWRMDTFKLWCWRRLWRVPWTTRTSNQSILKEINPEYLLEGLMLKLQYFGQQDWGQEKKGVTEDEMLGWHHWLNGHGFEQILRDGEGQGGLVCCNSWGHKESDTT